MKFKQLLILAAFIFSFATSAQGPFDTNINVIPPSPNVLDFNKGIEIPVSHYTGSVNVDVPIYTLSLPQIDLPIGLSYRTSGLRVEDHASWVGAGWTLNAGGNVSRTVKGLPDELTETHRDGWFSPRLNAIFNQDGSLDLDAILSCYSTDVPWPIVTPSDPLTRVDSIAFGWVDTEPDLFYFSTPGGGGKFVFDRSYNIKPLQEDDFTVLPPINLTGNFEWVITGPDGTQYLYEEKESTTSNSGCGRSMSAYDDPMTHVSAWQLNQIINSGDTVFFHYESEALSYGRKVTTTAKFPTSVGQGLPISTCSNSLVVGSQRLSYITTSYGDSIQFIASSSSRLDLSGSHSLDRIVVWKNNQKVKEIDLFYEYFGADEKLKLTKIQENDTKGNDSVPPYLFEYFSYGTFPSISSNSIDYWGYYNGATGGLFPPYKDAVNHINRTSTADREPSLTFAKVGSLERIAYPTGGNVIFDYELNSYFDDDYLKTYTYQAEAIGVVGEATPTSQLVTFSVAENCSATLDEIITINGTISPSSPNTYVELREKINGVFVDVDLASSGNRHVLPAGDYELYAYNSDPDGEAYISIEYEQEEAFNVPAGGLRIKSITEEDPSTQSGTRRDFKYLTDNGESSGKLFSPIKMGGKTSIYVPGHDFGTTCTDESAVIYIEMNAYSHVPMDTYSGSHIGYTKVTEIISAYQSGGLPPPGNGKIEYIYYNDVAAISNKFPFIQLTDLTYKNGKLREKIIYGESTANVFHEVQREKYLYTESTIHTDVTRGFKLSRYKSKYCFSCSEASLDTDYSLVDYVFRRKWFRLDTVTVTKYFQSKELEKVTTYAYSQSSEGHLFPMSEETEYSDGKKIVTEFTRATNPALLLGVDEFENSIQLNGMKRTLKGRLPLSIKQWNRDVTGLDKYEELSSITYENNRPVYQVASDGTEIVYVWGYKDEYPVAQVFNSTLAAVESLITPTYEGYLESQNPNHADLRSLFQHLRSNLPNSRVMGYLYEPGRGVIEEIDSNGKKRSYSYDGFNRLKDIKDNDANYISAFEYMFQSQN